MLRNKEQSYGREQARGKRSGELEKYYQLFGRENIGYLIPTAENESGKKFEKNAQQKINITDE